MSKIAKNSQGGFLQLIIFIIVLLFLMKYFNISISDAVNWFKTTFQNVLR